MTATQPTLVSMLGTLCAPAAPPDSDPEVRYLTGIERRLLDDPAGYAKGLRQLASERLLDERSYDRLRALLTDLAGQWEAGRIPAYMCAEAMRVCLADIVLLERLDATDVPADAVATMRGELLPASLDLAGRLVRNLAERVRIAHGHDRPADQEIRKLADMPRSPLRRLVPTRTALPEAARSSCETEGDPDEPLLVVLTAGRGTRLRTTLPKGLVPVGGVPMVARVVQAATRAGIRRRMFVLKYRAEVQTDYLARWGGVVVQERADGTGHSAFEILSALTGYRGPVALSFSDTPFMTRGSFERPLDRLASTGAALVLSSFRPAVGSAGRILRDRSGAVHSVGQPRLGAPDSDEADGGLYAIRRDPVLTALGEVTNDNARGEWNLPDAVARVVAMGGIVETSPGPAEEFDGVNVPRDLVLAELRASAPAEGDAAVRERAGSLVGPVLEPREGGDDADPRIPQL